MNARDKSKYVTFYTGFEFGFEKDLGLSKIGLEKNWPEMNGACFNDPSDETDKLYLNLLKWAESIGYKADVFMGYATPDGKHIRGFCVVPGGREISFESGLGRLENTNDQLNDDDRKKLEPLLELASKNKLRDFCIQYQEILNLSDSLLSADTSFTNALKEIEKTIYEAPAKQQTELLKKEIIRFYDMLGKKNKNANVEEKQMDEIQTKSLTLLSVFPLSASEKSNAEKNIRGLAKAVQNQPVEPKEAGVQASEHAIKKPAIEQDISIKKPSQKQEYDVFNSNFVSVEQEVGISSVGLETYFKDMSGACFENPNDETDKLYLNFIKWAETKGYKADGFAGYTTPDGKHIRGFIVAPQPRPLNYKQGLDSLANANSDPLDDRDRRKLKEILHDGYTLKLDDFCMQYGEILTLSRSLLSTDAKDFTDSLEKIKKTILGHETTDEELKQQSELLKKEIIRFYDLLGKKNKNANVEDDQMDEIQTKSLALLNVFPLSASEKSNAEKNIRELTKAVQIEVTKPKEEPIKPAVFATVTATQREEAKPSKPPVVSDENKKSPVVIVDSKENLETVKERIKACDEYLKHLNKSKNTSTFIKGKQHNVKADEKIKIVTGLKAILENKKDSAAEKILKFDDALQSKSKGFVTSLKKHRDSHLIRFLKYAGVVGAAILGLAGLGVGAFFAGKAAKEKLFNVKGEEFVSQVTKKR